MNDDGFSVSALTPEEFLNAYQFVMEVCHGSAMDQVRPPSDFKLRHGDEVLELADTPINRLGLAAARFFNGDAKKVQGFMFRMEAVDDLMEDPRLLGEYLKRIPGGFDVHPAVFGAAAVVPLRRVDQSTLRFDPAEFLAEVRKRDSESE